MSIDTNAIIIGRTTNKEVWQGTASWVLGGRLLLGQGWWKPVLIAIVIWFYNCIAILHASVS